MGNKESVSHLWRPSTVAEWAQRVDAQSHAGIDFSSLMSKHLNPAHLEAMRIVTATRKDARAASFDMLRSRILRKMEDQGWQTLVITSPEASAGKSVVAINLAFSIGRLPGYSAVLVDLDLRKPSLARYLGVKPDKRVVDILRGRAKLEMALFKPGDPKLNVACLAGGPPLKSPSDMLDQRSVRSLVTELKAGGDTRRIVILDTAPVLAADEFATVLAETDCVLMVAAVGSSRTGSILEAERQLGAANYLGTVLNKARETVDTYGY
jgi:Mrp family chromosome partitioning ATPase